MDLRYNTYNSQASGGPAMEINLDEGRSRSPWPGEFRVDRPIGSFITREQGWVRVWGERAGPEERGETVRVCDAPPPSPPLREDRGMITRSGSGAPGHASSAHVGAGDLVLIRCWGYRE